VFGVHKVNVVFRRFLSESRHLFEEIFKNSFRFLFANYQMNAENSLLRKFQQISR